MFSDASNNFAIDEIIVKEYCLNHPLVFSTLENSSLQLLNSYKIIPEYLNQNFNRQRHTFNSINESFDGESFLVESIRIARDGCLTITDPFYGEHISSNDMVTAPSEPWPVVPVYGFRFSTADKNYYRLYIGHTICQEIGFFFPEIGLVIVNPMTSINWVKSFVESWRIYVLSNHSKISNLLLKSIEQKPVVLIMNSHFAHNYWNELAFVEALVNNNLHKNVAFICRSSPLGRLSDIFQEISFDQVTDFNSDFSSFYSALIDNSSYCIPCGRRFIPQSLRERVIKYALNKNSHIDKDFKYLKKNHFPIIWLSLRTDARTWINQEDGIPTLLNELYKKWPNMAVLIDGTSYSEASSTSSSTSSTTINERELLSKILKKLTVNLVIVDLIGLKLTESFYWMQAANLYITPHGTIQHKIGWFTSIPGVVHCGENLRKEVEINNHFATFKAAEGSIAPSYVFGDVARDDNIDLRGDMYSYNLAWGKILEKVNNIQL